MYCTPTELRKARAQHRCTNCGQMIEAGEDYVRWASYDDGHCFTNKMHPECLDSLQDESGSFEYMPYSGERPDVVTPNVVGKGRCATLYRAASSGGRRP